MPIDGIDFEGNAVAQPANNASDNPANQPDTTGLNGEDHADITGKDNKPDNNGNDSDPNNNGNDNNNNPDNKEGNDDNNPSTGDLEAGTQVEFDGATYTVSENGDLVDKDGNVFKQKSELAAWLKENNASDSDDDDNELSLSAIKNAVGIDVTDDNGIPIEFTNDAAGVKSYVDAVINLKTSEVAQGAVNKLFNDNPMLKQFIDYVQITGSPKGFGDIPDRSDIVLDKDNEYQLEAVIRMAAKEFGNKSLNENYIKYLKSSGSLYDEAKAQLEALVGKDKAYRKEIEAQAKAAREQEQKEINEYWQGVSNAINNRNINGYKLPESITKEINGQKITLTLDDFYKYVAEAREVEGSGETMTGYQRDLNKLSNEELLNRELLDAWLMFSGGSYKDLINMATEEEKVRKLIIKSKQQRSNRTIKVVKPNQSKVNPDDIVLS